jgi:hypothetical protein
MNIFSKKISASSNIRIEDAIDQTLERRFKSEIPLTIPDCYVDLISRDMGNGQNGNLLSFTKTEKIEMFESNDLPNALLTCGVKTVGVIDPRCSFRMFINESLDNIKKEIRTYFQNNQADPGGGQPNASIDSFVFEGTNNKFFAYTNVLLPHLKKQIELRFAPFLKAGGAIVSVQDRYAPITCFTSKILPESAELSTLFCEISDYEMHIWVAVQCGNGVFSPLTAYSSDDLSHLDFSIDSVMAQTLKQYRFGTPRVGVLLDGRINGISENEEMSTNHIEQLLETHCQKVIKVDAEQSRCASLNGARSLSAEHRKKKTEHEESAQRQIPRVNVTSMEWAHNYLIPIALREFYRKGMTLIACLSLFICICGGVYWFTTDLRVTYEGNIVGLQNGTAKKLKDYSMLKEHSEEFSQLSGWKNNPDIATQFSAAASFLMRSNCLLVQAVFHSKIQDLPAKTLEEIKPEVERLTKSTISTLDMAGIWSLSFRLPISGISTNDMRKNIITALQKDATESFVAPFKSLLVLNGEQGQNTMNMLKNDNSMSAILLIWRTQNGTGRR